MKINVYRAPQVAIVLPDMDIMQTLPVGGSQDYTNSGDDDGGGLAKDNPFDYEEDNPWGRDPWENIDPWE